MTDDRFLSQDYSSLESLRVLRLFRNADFDPTGGILTAGLALGGGALSAAGTLAGGSAAATMGRLQQQAEQFQATQDRMNAAGDIAGAQRQAIDISQRANLTRSTAVASAAAGGVVTTSGSPVTNQAQISARGNYASRLALFNGQNAATSDINKATAAEYTGQMDLIGGQLTKQASDITAAGTLASAGASAFKMYGKMGGSTDSNMSYTDFGTGGASYPMF